MNDSLHAYGSHLYFAVRVSSRLLVATQSDTISVGRQLSIISQHNVPQIRRSLLRCKANRQMLVEDYVAYSALHHLAFLFSIDQSSFIAIYHDQCIDRERSFRCSVHYPHRNGLLKMQYFAPYLYHFYQKWRSCPVEELVP